MTLEDIVTVFVMVGILHGIAAGVKACSEYRLPASVTIEIQRR